MTRHAWDPAASVCAVLAGPLALSLALGGAKPVAAAATLEELAAPLNIDPTFITVSGISSGGFMAHQFHVAHSGVQRQLSCPVGDDCGGRLGGFTGDGRHSRRGFCDRRF